jgi:hypothetical protein
MYYYCNCSNCNKNVKIICPKCENDHFYGDERDGEIICFNCDHSMLVSYCGECLGELKLSEFIEDFAPIPESDFVPLRSITAKKLKNMSKDSDSARNNQENSTSIDSDEVPDWMENRKNKSNLEGDFFQYFEENVAPVIVEVVKKLEEINIPIVVNSNDDTKLNYTLLADVDDVAEIKDYHGSPTSGKRQVRLTFQNDILVASFELYAWNGFHKEYSFWSESSKGFNIVDSESPISLNEMYSIFEWLIYNTNITPFNLDLEELEELEELSMFFNLKAPCPKCKKDVQVKCDSCKGTTFTYMEHMGEIVDYAYRCADCGMNMPLYYCEHGFFGGNNSLLPAEHFKLIPIE